MPLFIILVLAFYVFALCSSYVWRKWRLHHRLWPRQLPKTRMQLVEQEGLYWSYCFEVMNADCVGMDSVAWQHCCVLHDDCVAWKQWPHVGHAVCHGGGGGCHSDFSLDCVLCPALVSVTWEIVVHGEVCSQCDLCVFSLYVLGDTWCAARGTMHWPLHAPCLRPFLK